jgi:hypothetical protein
MEGMRTAKSLSQDNALSFFQNKQSKLKIKLNSMAFSPQANYTDRTTAAYRRS